MKIKYFSLFFTLSVLWSSHIMADLNDGLLAYYPFNGNANDESGHGNHGIVHGANLTEDRAGHAQSAFYFDGSNNYIEIPRGHNLNIRGALTLSAWVRPTNYNSTNSAEKTIVWGATSYYLSLDRQRKALTNYRYGMTNPGYHHTEENSVPENGDSLITSVWDGQTLKQFINGELVNTIENVTRTASPTNGVIRIGKEHCCGNRAFNGIIDEVRIYNRALSECEVKALYAGQNACVQNCQLYGVNDKGLNDTQFFTVSSENFEVSALGDTHAAFDIEALDIHPQTGQLFAASGDDSANPGHLYRVDKETGALTDLGSTDYPEINGLSFHPNGDLWGWASGHGLITIDTTTAKATLISEYDGKIEDLTWNTAGTILFGVKNIYNQPGTGTQLISYDGTTIKKVCEKITQSLEIEALDTLPDDTLIFGFHNQAGLPLGVLDTVNCQIVESTNIATDYNDVEGLAWAACQ